MKNKLDIKYWGLVIGLVLSIVKPSMEMGSFKQTVLQLKEAQAQDEVFKNNEYIKAITLESRLSKLETKIDNQSETLNRINNSVSKMWEVVRKTN